MNIPKLRIIINDVIKQLKRVVNGKKGKGDKW